jgi:hypothetical protein
MVFLRNGPSFVTLGSFLNLKVSLPLFPDFRMRFQVLLEPGLASGTMNWNLQQ